jgi:hypothetical protein
MEIPATGRAIVNETFNHVEIIIPVKKNYLFLLAPVAGIASWWLIGGVGIFQQLLIPLKDSGLFGYFWVGWFCFVTLVGFRALWWMLAGKEIINVGDGVLSIKRQGDWVARTKSYDLAEATNFRADDSNNDGNSRKYKKMGTLQFEYGADTIKFGEDLPEAEGNYILQRLKSRKVLTDRNF